jgi:hypothetical protein
VLALDAPEVLQQMAPSDWDDLEHLRSARSNALIADAIAAVVAPAPGKP